MALVVKQESLFMNKMLIEPKIETEKTSIPEGIVTYLERRAGIKRDREPLNFSVSKIIGCLRKTYYREMGVEKDILSRDIELENLWSTTRGDLLHEITRAYKWRELDADYKVFLKNGRFATVSGRLDMYDWKSMTVIDLKTTKFVDWQIRNGYIPKAEHILQVQIYGTIFSRLIPIEKLCLVYADMNQLVAYRVKRKDMSTWITERVRKLDNSLNRKTPPQGEVSGLCQFCNYQKKCLEDGNGISYKSKTRSLKNKKVPIDQSGRGKK